MAASRSLRVILGESGDSAGFAKADRVIDFAFPRDHGAHPDFRSEWWYLTAVLADPQGRRFGVQFTLFRQGIKPMSTGETAPVGAQAWRTGQVYMAHVAVSDVAARRHVAAERVVRGHPALAGVSAAPFEAHLEGWRLAAAGAEFWPLRLLAETPDFDIDLSLTGTKPVVRQGEGGLSRKGPANASYYYSIPRIRAEGAVAIDGVRHAVAGLAWLDREWSTSVLASEYQGWDWFALALDDGRDLMLFRLRRFDGRADDYNAGSAVAADGEARILAAGDFELTVQDRWRGWPVTWRLTLAQGPQESFTIQAAFEDQVMDASVRYWEGVVDVRDDAGDRVGGGYMELTGYPK